MRHENRKLDQGKKRTSPDPSLTNLSIPAIDCGMSPIPPRGRSRRDPAAVRQAMLAAAEGQANIDYSKVAEKPQHGPSDHKEIGLLLGELEDQRWHVAPPVARAKLNEAGLPYKGRRAGLIYSWRSILRAEGVDTEIAEKATVQTHPDLYEDLLDTARAALLLGYRDSSSIRKLVGTGQLSEIAYVKFGSRGVYRLRPAALNSLRKTPFQGLIV